MIISAIGVGGWAVNWMVIGRAIVFPAILAAAAALFLAFRAARRDSPDFAHALRLALVGIAAALMLWRILLNGNIQLTGFFLEPLAALFLIHLLAVEASRWGGGRTRKNWLLPLTVALLVSCGGFQLERISLDHLAHKTYAVGAGRDRFYTFPPDYWPNGYVLNEMMDAVATHFPNARTLTAFPDSAAVNYFLRLPNPLPESEFEPTPLGFVGKNRVLDDLRGHPPDIVIVFARDLTDFGVPYFGYNDYSGLEILQWVRQNYHSAFVLTYGQRATPLTATGHTFDLYTRQVPSPTGH